MVSRCGKHTAVRARSGWARRLLGRGMNAITVPTAAHWRPRMKRLLRETFGIKRLREGQAAVIERVMQGLPTLAIMPTSAGKSLCYQVPALLLPGRAGVVSPLIALMKAQCEALLACGVHAAQWHSGLTAEERASAESAITAGEARIVFSTPERLADPGFLALMSQQTTSLLVVDEAHRVSQWGHNFRPAFMEIASAKSALGQPALLMLTATATPDVIDDIAVQLGAKNLGVVNTGIYRPNLHYRVEQVATEADKLARVLALLNQTPGPCIVYAATVTTAAQVHEALQAAGESVTLYHGRLPKQERSANQEAFMRNEVRIMVATNAFGLGIDKPDTRFVLHHQMPSGLDAYYQESGRAGCDGQPATCTLLFLRQDRAVQRFFMAGRYPDVEGVEAMYQAFIQGPPEGQRWTLNLLQERLHRPDRKLQVALQLRQQGIVAQDRAGHLRLLRAGLSDEALDRLLVAYRDRREHDKAKLEQMVFYGQTGLCRWKILRDHFDEGDGFERCGHCDNCLRLDALQQESAQQESPVAEDLPALPRAVFAEQNRVRVPRYGTGIVTAADAETVTVAFPQGATRCFLSAYVQAAPATSPRLKRPSAPSPS